MNPTISVQIVTFNNRGDIENCIESVRVQTYPISEIVIVDNASQDGTLEYVQLQIDVRLISNHENKGFAAAHNQAIQSTQTDYVLILNPDVILNPDYLYNLIQVMEQNSNIGSATGLLYRKSDSTIVDSTGLIIHKSRRAFDRCSGKRINEIECTVDIFGVSAAAAVYRRSMIKEISWRGQFYDEDFFAYKEDVDVSWRAQLFGWEAAFVKEATASHERGWKEGGRNTKPLFVRRHSYINRYRMIIKNDSIFYLLKHMHKWIIFEIVSLGYFLIRDPALFKAWIPFLKSITMQLAKRKWVQKHRKVPFRRIYEYFES